jgi:hypothetical protein
VWGGVKGKDPCDLAHPLCLALTEQQTGACSDVFRLEFESEHHPRFLIGFDMALEYKTNKIAVKTMTANLV